VRVVQLLSVSDGTSAIWFATKSTLAVSITDIEAGVTFHLRLLLCRLLKSGELVNFSTSDRKMTRSR
jgi:hypothetical protein